METQILANEAHARFYVQISIGSMLTNLDVAESDNETLIHLIEVGALQRVGQTHTKPVIITYAFREPKQEVVEQKPYDDEETMFKDWIDMQTGERFDI